MTGETPEEDLMGWLERLDIPVEDTGTIETFKDYLRDEFGITGDAQVEALWKSVKVDTDFAEHGIHAVTARYPWGNELRYGVQGMSGLWGFAAVQAIRAGEEW